MSELNLSNLSHQELKLYDIVKNTNGLMEDISKQLSEQGIFGQYQIIHQKYVEIINQSSDETINIEATKRAIFISWYALTEPSCFTGIGEINKTAARESYNFLNNLIEDKKIDNEFAWMLPYYSSWDWAILSYTENDFIALNKFIDKADRSTSYIPRKQIVEETMSDRGQMGIYWKSISKSHDT